MDEVDVGEMVDRLRRSSVTQEEIVGRAIRRLYSIEEDLRRYRSRNRNGVRTVIAYVKLLYDFGQQMFLSRLYLMHKIKLLEVREDDLNFEISMIRGVTPVINEGSPSSGSTAGNTVGDVNRGQSCDKEMDIALDTRIIEEIDHSREVLQDLSQRIAENKKTLVDIEREADEISASFVLSRDSHKIESEQDTSRCSKGLERSQELCMINRSRVGDTRSMSPNYTNYTNMAMLKENEETLPSQGEYCQAQWQARRCWVDRRWTDIMRGHYRGGLS